MGYGQPPPPAGKPDFPLLLLHPCPLPCLLKVLFINTLGSAVKSF